MRIAPLPFVGAEPDGTGRTSVQLASKRDVAKRFKTNLLVFLAAGTALAVVLAQATPAAASIAFTGINVGEGFVQTGPSTLSGIINPSISFTMDVQNPSNFTNVSVTSPAGVTVQILYNPVLDETGNYNIGSTTSPTFSNVAALNAAFPFGVYTFVATNSTTGASQTTTLDYDYNHWPSAPGALTAASYSGAQGMDPSKPYEFDFNSFTGDGYNPFYSTNGQIDPSTQIYIWNYSTGKVVYTSPWLPDTATSYVLPADTLNSGTYYGYGIDFLNSIHGGLSQPAGYFMNFFDQTAGLFSTSVGSAAPKTLANITGGTPTNPTPLPIVGQIGDVTGKIGGQGSTDFYKFFWAGGEFTASTSLTGANSDAEYLFELLNPTGNIITELTLNEADGFTGTINWDLTYGLYSVGILADSAADPAYDIHFVTPVTGIASVVPEPATWATMLAGLGLAGAAIRQSRRRAPARLGSAASV